MFKTSTIVKKRKSHNNLKSQRIAANLTLAELSNATPSKIKPSRISNWEHGRSEIGLDSAVELAAVLNCSTAYLLGIDDETGLTLGKHQQELYSLLSQIALRGDEDVRLVSAMLKAFLNNKP